MPAYLAQEVAETAERIHYRDNWARQMMRERKYTPGQIDTKWSPEMDKEFKAWVEEQKKSKTLIRHKEENHGGLPPGQVVFFGEDFGKTGKDIYNLGSLCQK